MDWIITLAAIMAGIFISALFVWKTKAQRGGPVPGPFDFGRHKARELSQRGLFDKTRWR
jgi:hypothetical protein